MLGWWAEGKFHLVLCGRSFNVCWLMRNFTERRDMIQCHSLSQRLLNMTTDPVVFNHHKIISSILYPHTNFIFHNSNKYHVIDLLFHMCLLNHIIWSLIKRLRVMQIKYIQSTLLACSQLILCRFHTPQVSLTCRSTSCLFAHIVKTKLYFVFYVYTCIRVF